MTRVDFMRPAIELSRIGMETDQGAPCCAVIVIDGKIVGGVMTWDGLIYDEIAKPMGEQKIPSTQRLFEAANTVFEDWLKKPNRIHY